MYVSYSSQHRQQLTRALMTFLTKEVATLERISVIDTQPLTKANEKVKSIEDRFNKSKDLVPTLKSSEKELNSVRKRIEPQNRVSM